MSNDFRQQLNKVCRDKEDVLRKQEDREISDCHQNARLEYDNLKKELLNQVSSGNYIQSNNKKCITYLYHPLYMPCSYTYDDGIRSEIKGRFSPKLKVTDTGTISYKPRNPHKWELYIDEIKRLGNKDGITICAVITSDMDSTIYSYPTITRNKNFKIYCGIKIYLRCTVEF